MHDKIMNESASNKSSPTYKKSVWLTSLLKNVALHKEACKIIEQACTAKLSKSDEKFHVF